MEKMVRGGWGLHGQVNETHAPGKTDTKNEQTLWDDLQAPRRVSLGTFRASKGRDIPILRKR